jgi:hypothetical protein
MAHYEDRARKQNPPDADVDRYRQAAEETLDQLDWCVSYLYRIRKDAIAQVIDRNRSLIRRRMRA